MELQSLQKIRFSSSTNLISVQIRSAQVHYVTVSALMERKCSCAQLVDVSPAEDIMPGPMSARKDMTQITERANNTIMDTLHGQFNYHLSRSFHHNGHRFIIASASSCFLTLTFAPTNWLSNSSFSTILLLVERGDIRAPILPSMLHLMRVGSVP